MIRNSIAILKKRMERYVRYRLEQMSPQSRIKTVLLLLVLFGTLAFYMTVSSLYELGKGKRNISIERIRYLNPEAQTDSIQTIKPIQR
ncbi:DUF3989 domain-containing protein [Porphyromonas gingivalis]|uniref:TraL conjugative transposon family protein n=2 Tax=Porphyromonas TaxID=836 RepID=UPI00052D5777|nr:TraL conjugative transposon family protein [Porphyromonas gulae]ATS11006.1 DUF3989 domain-containing protein [Porphyromonas gingivalis]KGN71035.1 hypothetical protein HR09_01635 [Porphyromonas gulae]